LNGTSAATAAARAAAARVAVRAVARVVVVTAVEKGALGVARARGVSATVEVEEKVVVEMVDEVATPAEPEAMADVAAVRAAGVTEVTWVETEEERTELVVAAVWAPAMVVVVVVVSMVVVAIGRSHG
jgi:hypothetical protein